MSVYMTEEEQLENIKKWWQRHSNTITVIASSILLIIAGFKYWNWHQEKITQQASSSYEHLMIAFTNQDNKSIRAFSNQLLTEFKDTAYADAARLTLAKLYVSRSKYAKAQEQLQYVAVHSKIPSLQQIAKIRLARLFINDKAFDKALTELNQINDQAYKPMINEIKGDVYAAKGQYPEAMKSYQQAISETQTQGIGNLFLEMKTNELAALTHSYNVVKPIPHVA